MTQVLLALGLISTIGSTAHAMSSADEIISTTVQDVTSEYMLVNPPIAFPTITPAPSSSPSVTTGSVSTTTLDTSALGLPVNLDQLITLGTKLWSFVLDNKPNAQFQKAYGSVVPSGVTDWTKLTGWKLPVTKIYRVEFKSMFGRVEGFEYSISFVPGGTYQGKGRYLGNIIFLPGNVQLHTGRSLDVKAEILQTLNSGTEENPIAMTQISVTWTTPTLTRVQLNSAIHTIYGTGEIQ